MLSYLRTHLFFQLSFGLMSVFYTLLQLPLAIFTQIRAMDVAKVTRVNFNPMTLVELSTLTFAWNY